MKKYASFAAGAALIFTPTVATAASAMAIAQLQSEYQSVKISGVDVVVKGNGNVVTRAQIGADGQVVLNGLVRGEYEIDIDGASLQAAIDKLGPPPEQKSGGSSFSLGVGGMFGGGSKHSSSHEGSGHEGEGPMNGHPDSGHGSSHSGGGVGLDVSLPAGGSNPGEPPPAYFKIELTEVLVSSIQGASNGAPAEWREGGDPSSSRAQPGETMQFSLDTPYCRDGASKGAGIQFTIPDGGGSVTMRMSIADQASAGNLTSY